MTTIPIPHDLPHVATRRGPTRRHPVDRLAERGLRKRLESLEHGLLVLVDNEREQAFGRLTPRCALRATIRVHDPRFYSEIAFGGSLGAGEAYMQHLWSTDDPAAVTRILLQNRAVLEGLDSGLGRVTAPLHKALHAFARNTRRGSRRNIAAHYDLGNALFELMLDPTMMYSSAVFEREDMTLEEASVAKLDRICRKLGLRPGLRVLEIGTGWGGFALHAASRYGCHVTTTTISREQHALAQRRVAAAGLGDRVTLLLDDYRDLEGQFDRVVSIEMIEAIGHQYFDTFFDRCSALLTADGLMLLQAITIADQHYASARDSVDFIKRYIFPGCCIPSVSALGGSIGRSGDLRVIGLEDIGLHYARTLALWRANFMARVESVRALGYSDAFIRMWEFYLAYCEGGFAECALGDVQMLIAKPHFRGHGPQGTASGGQAWADSGPVGPGPSFRSDTARQRGTTGSQSDGNECR